MKDSPWILVDTETSGLSNPIYCVEIAAQRMRGPNPEGPPFSVFLNHDVELERRAVSTHGYTREFLRSNGRPPREAHLAFAAYVGDAPIWSFNLSYDFRVLESEWARLAMPSNLRRGLCLLEIARRCIPSQPSYKLQDLRRAFLQEANANAHSASGDISTTQRLFSEVIWPHLCANGRGTLQQIEELLMERRPRPCEAAPFMPLAVEVKPGSLNGLRFVFTGQFETMSREQAEEIAQRAGAKTSSSVSGKTTHVVAGYGAGSKLLKAQAAGIPVLDETEFLRMILP
jgi:DNA polymerase III epsilon subunit-like protein